MFNWFRLEPLFLGLSEFLDLRENTGNLVSWSTISPSGGQRIANLRAFGSKILLMTKQGILGHPIREAPTQISEDRPSIWETPFTRHSALAAGTALHAPEETLAARRGAAQSDGERTPRASCIYVRSPVLS